MGTISPTPFKPSRNPISFPQMAAFPQRKREGRTVATGPALPNLAPRCNNHPFASHRAPRESRHLANTLFSDPNLGPSDFLPFGARGVHWSNARRLGLVLGLEAREGSGVVGLLVCPMTSSFQ